MCRSIVPRAPWIVKKIMRLELILAYVTAFAHALDVWAPSRWTLRLDIGREAGTKMPREWAASGARLALAVSVEVGSDRAADGRELGGGASLLRAVEAPTFVGGAGLRTVGVDGGGWTLRADTLRCWLDLGGNEAPIERNDVTLPAERLYLSAVVWRGDAASAAAAAAIAPFRSATREAQAALEAALDHETGDRRLDGADAVEMAKAYADVAGLVARRDASLLRLRNAEDEFPSRAPEDVSEAGAWPGAPGKVAFASGEVAVKRRGFFGDDYVLLGTWRAVPESDPGG